MIARNPKNHDDQWLVAAAYFADNFELAWSADGPLDTQLFSEETLKAISKVPQE